MKKLITVIGRGHSGTRAMSHTLSASGVFMGEPLNKSGDLLPPNPMYEACRLFARNIQQLGTTEWDFTKALNLPVDPAFEQLIQEYLTSVLSHPSDLKGWKIPETTLAFPWIAKLFPDAYYIHWVRDPRDGVLSQHKTDDLADFNVPYTPTEDLIERRAISWKYQTEIVKATPKPKHFHTVRFEDFVLDQENTLASLEQFLGIPLARIEVRPETVGRWKQLPTPPHFPFWQNDLQSFGYS